MIPVLTADQMREVDRIMVEDLEIELIQMMENAGAHLAELAQRLFRPARATVLAGPGGNGGGGLVAARHLANRGVEVSVALSIGEGTLTPVPAHQLAIVRRMGLAVGEPAGAPDVVLDALIGYSLRGDPSGGAAELIVWANQQNAPVLSLDTPSGLDVTTGHVGQPCVRATATMMLALPKAGLLKAPDVVGSLYVADISVPSLVYRQIGLDVEPIFADDTIIPVPHGQ